MRRDIRRSLDSARVALSTAAPGPADAHDAAAPADDAGATGRCVAAGVVPIAADRSERALVATANQRSRRRHSDQSDCDDQSNIRKLGVHFISDLLTLSCAQEIFHYRAR